MAQFTEDEKIMRRLEQRFNKGVVKYRLIEDGDKILIGLSGGKDSLALLELLARRSRILKPKFTVIAVHVGMTNIPYQSDLEYLKGYSEDLGVPFVHYETFLIRVPTLEVSLFPLFLESEKSFVHGGKGAGCNKIVLGHHMDDILETLLMNITFQGAFSTMPPKLVMRKFEMTIIRPMCLVHEADLIEMARIRGFRKQIKDCPYESLSNRSNMKEVLYSLEK